MKLLVTGRGGQVGHALDRIVWPAGWQVAAFDRAGLDITERAAVFVAIGRERPDLVVNAAAYTAVDRAESEAAAAWAGNAEGPANLAAACREAGIPLIHISTDYVFDGSKTGAYREDDPVNPLGVYGRSKEAGERAVRAALARHVILRTAWVYSAHGHNFARTMLRLAAGPQPTGASGGERPVLRVVADQQGAPTGAGDIAAAIASIARQLAAGNAAWGTYHFTGGGMTTWHGFAEAIFAEAAPWRGTPPIVEPITTEDYPTPARRPKNSALDCARIGVAFDIAPRPWRTALAEVIREIYANR
jgi:dTDP-4-dehydrorhamnose reductase